jgi:hypothetical protein
MFEETALRSRTKVEMGDATARLDKLAAKCLFPSERDAIPIHLHNLPGGVGSPIRHEF